MASSRKPSFLKKIGSDNTSTLHIPSSFAKSQAERLSASLTLEGPSTGKWTVAVKGSFTKCNVSLGQGWAEFVKDHHLQLGDQLLFTLMEDSYFLVEVYDESGCVKLSALDAINSALAVDSEDTNDTAPAFEVKHVEGDKSDKSSKGDEDCSSAKPQVERKMSSSEPAKVSPPKKAAISLSSSDDEQDGPSASVARSEKLRSTGKRGRPKKSQDFYQDVEEEDFSLFHRPRARNTPKRSAAEDAGEAVKRMSTAKKKPEKEVVVAPPPRARGFEMNDKVGHGYLRCQFLIDGSLEEPIHAVEAS